MTYEKALLLSRIGMVVFVVLAVILALIYASGCHLHMGEVHRHIHRAMNEPTKAADVLDDILERLYDVETNLGDKDVQADDRSDPNGHGE